MSQGEAVTPEQQVNNLQLLKTYNELKASGMKAIIAANTLLSRVRLKPCDRRFRSGVSLRTFYNRISKARSILDAAAAKRMLSRMGIDRNGKRQIKSVSLNPYRKNYRRTNTARR